MPPSVSSLKNLDLSLLAQRLGRQCLQLGVEVTTAESCTGGGIASAITSVAGSSAYFTAGYVTYSNAAKTRLLGVEPAMLDAHGAVSEQVVNAMVAGACQESGADWGSSEQQQAECFHFPGDRQAVREQAVREALAGLVARLSAQAQKK